MKQQDQVQIIRTNVGLLVAEIEDLRRRVRSGWVTIAILSAALTLDYLNEGDTLWFGLWVVLTVLSVANAFYWHRHVQTARRALSRYRREAET